MATPRGRQYRHAAQRSIAACDGRCWRLPEGVLCDARRSGQVEDTNAGSATASGLRRPASTRPGLGSSARSTIHDGLAAAGHPKARSPPDPAGSRLRGGSIRTSLTFDPEVSGRDARGSGPAGGGRDERGRTPSARIRAGCPDEGTSGHRPPDRRPSEATIHTAPRSLHPKMSQKERAALRPPFPVQQQRKPRPPPKRASWRSRKKVL